MTEIDLIYLEQAGDAHGRSRESIWWSAMNRQCHLQFMELLNEKQIIEGLRR